MTSAILLSTALLAQSAPVIPSSLGIPSEGTRVYSITQTFGDPADEPITMIDRVETRWSPDKKVDDLKRFEFVHQVIPKKLMMGEISRPVSGEGYKVTEIRTERNVQFRWSCEMEFGDEFMLTSRFWTVPLPVEPVGKGGTWQVTDNRYLGYTFTGRYHDADATQVLVRLTYSSTDKANPWSAKGWARLDPRTGWPIKINLDAKNIKMPGSEEDPMPLKFILESE